MDLKPGLKPLALLFAGCVAAYAAAFYGIERFRTRSGPWEISFATENGTPVLTVNQPKLKIKNLRFAFPGAAETTSVSQTQTFAAVRPVPFAVPFGQCVFQDATSLPGTVTLQLFGHEIQLLPRVLTVDKKEMPWQSDTTLPIPPP